jgi:hypothetical protein
MTKSLTLAAAFAIAIATQALPSQAVTVGFGGPDVDPYVESGFTIDVARIVGGNCAVAPCMALNKNEISNLSRIGGGLFSLTSFFLKTEGNPAQLTVTSFLNGIAQLTKIYDVPKKTSITITDLFVDATSISFANSGTGNIRIDDLNASIPVSAVPLPAGLPLLISGLFGLGMLKRRRDKALG